MTMIIDQKIASQLWMDGEAFLVPSRLKQIDRNYLVVDPIEAYRTLGLDVKETVSPDWFELLNKNEVKVVETPDGWQYVIQGIRPIDAQMLIDIEQRVNVPMAFTDNPVLR